MKRGLVLQVRTSQDNQTKETLAWVTVGCIPSQMQDGRLYYPKSSDILITTVAGETRSPDKFKKYKDLAVGSVVDLHIAINEYTNKAFVNDIQIVKESAYSYDDLFSKKNGK